MSKGSSSKSASSAAAGKKAAQSPPKGIKKERSLKSLFSFFKPSRNDKKPPSLPESNYPNNKPATKTLGFSTSSLPTQASPTEEDENDESSDSDSPRTGRWHSTSSLPSQVRPPFARHSPTSSSSSASSFEFPSDASTAATSPSNSSPSVLIKSVSSAPITTMSSAVPVVSSPSVEYNTSPNQAPMKPLKVAKTSKRITDNYQKQPSPLSSVMDAHSPYIFPAPPSMSTYENQAKRRSSLGNFLLRRSQSHPDLADLTQEDLPPLPPMPASAPSLRPTSSSSSISRVKTFRRRSGDPRDGVGGYTDQEKIERISILGADPAGYGYYLYPTSQKETSNNQRNSGMAPPSGKRGRPGYVDDWKRGSWGGSGPDGFGGGRGGSGAPGGRAWKDSRGRGFRRTVAQQAIPEEAGDAFDPESSSNRRFSEGFSPGSDCLGQNPTLAKLAPSILTTLDNEATVADKLTSSEKKERGQSFHNSSDSIQAHEKVQELLPSQVPGAKTDVSHSRGQDDEVVLRKLQQGVQGAMDTIDSVAEALDGKMANFSRPSTAGSGKQTKVVEIKDSLPMIRIDMIKA